ncbi:MAG: Ribosomal large subunit pseudouridine synthase D [Firmicutes bacterium ADurb.Bin182]|nr:MAG: Ribosomal large subunit pseudouridine synthase D [Firmicutes bacterium ADurb.Bin182]
MDDNGLENSRELTFFAEKDGERLDVFCARACSETRSYMQRVVASGNVYVNERTEKSNYRLKKGDNIRIMMPEPEKSEVEPQNIPLEVLYQDDDIAVIDKPKGMVVHPAPGNPDRTLVNAIMYHVRDLSGIGGEMRPGIVHRIDKMTSGLIVIAKNDKAHRSLSEQFKRHTAKRTYLAIVEGNIKEDEGTVDAPVGRHPVDRKRMAVVGGGRSAVTHWRVLERFGRYTLIEASLETGRTHQIRVHMAHIKHPLAGDTVYGASKPKLNLDGQALHAIKLELIHPGTGRKVEFTSDLPDYFAAVLSHLRSLKQ